MKKGLVQVYTGEGKGKTTAAIGQIVRARGRGYKAFLLQFLKKKEGSGELSLLEELGVKVVCRGGEHFQDLNKLTNEERGRITSEWDNLLDEVNKEVVSRRYDLLVLDEINVALHYGLISKEKVLSLIRRKPAFLEVIDNRESRFGKRGKGDQASLPPGDKSEERNRILVDFFHKGECLFQGFYPCCAANMLNTKSSCGVGKLPCLS